MSFTKFIILALAITASHGLSLHAEKTIIRQFKCIKTDPVAGCTEWQSCYLKPDATCAWNTWKPESNRVIAYLSGPVMDQTVSIDNGMIRKTTKIKDDINLGNH